MTSEELDRKRVEIVEETKKAIARAALVADTGPEIESDFILTTGANIAGVCLAMCDLMRAGARLPPSEHIRFIEIAAATREAARPLIAATRERLAKIDAAAKKAGPQ